MGAGMYNILEFENCVGAQRGPLYEKEGVSYERELEPLVKHWSIQGRNAVRNSNR